MKIGYFFIAAFLVSLGIVIFGEAGLYSAYKISQENAKLSARISQLESENSRLLHDISEIEKSPRKLEHMIRASLSLVGKDEILFEFEE
ncbi:MAG: septum formation initiator family protein [Oligoflexia bacterium]|nr:septum formation initiator family protein [Oligoflexia bacterium]